VPVPSSRLARAIAIAGVTLGVIVAAYVGFRLPGLWTTTLDGVSLFDGFHRRFLVGTLLHPLGLHYAVFAAFSFAVLAALLAIIVVAALRARNPLQYGLLVAWLMIVGGFAFNEVGYFDQLLYVMLFGALWLAERDRLVAAVAVMAVTPLVHEIAIITVVPLFGVAMLRREPLKRAIVATLIPAAVDGVVLMISPASAGATDRLAARFAAADIHARADALSLFMRSQHDTWQMYSPHNGLVLVRPLMYTLVAMFVVFWFAARPSLGTRDRGPEWLVAIASIAAIAMPHLLCYAGWDANRWMFATIASFTFIVWLTLERRPEPAATLPLATVVLVAMLVVSRIDLMFFDFYKPRVIGYSPIHAFERTIATGQLFEQPEM
jgi:hypothetical protein